MQAESEVQSLTKRVRSLEEEFEQTENRLQAASEKLEEASKAADESERSDELTVVANTIYRPHSRCIYLSVIV